MSTIDSEEDDLYGKQLSFRIPLHIQTNRNIWTFQLCLYDVEDCNDNCLSYVAEQRKRTTYRAYKNAECGEQNGEYPLRLHLCDLATLPACMLQKPGFTVSMTKVAVIFIESAIKKMLKDGSNSVLVGNRAQFLGIIDTDTYIPICRKLNIPDTQCIMEIF